MPKINSDEVFGSGEFRTTRKPLTGLFDGVTLVGKQVTYSAIEGLAIFEGDIVLGPIQETTKPPPGVPAGVAIVGSSYRWPRATVPYEIDPNFPNQTRVTDAIREIEQKTGIRFVQRTAANGASHPDYIRFEDHGNAWSSVGMQGGKQIISLGLAYGKGSATHEIGHSLGLWHEQSREDRDQFVRIEYANIYPNEQHNFNQHITDGDDVGNYDYGSIMHYPSVAFSMNGQATIITLKPGGQQIGQRQGLSAGDIQGLKTIYGLTTPQPKPKPW